MAESTFNCEKLPTMEQKDAIGIERTLAIIKPDGMGVRDKIVKHIRRSGFQILQTRIVKLTVEQSSEFFMKKYKDPLYPMMVIALTEGPIQAMCIAKKDAIDSWKLLMGPSRISDAKKLFPNSLRALYCESNNEFHNILHGSDSLDEANHEIHFFFPNMILEPIFDKPHQHRYLQGAVNPVLLEGLYHVAKQRPEDPINWLAKWLLENNPYNKSIMLPPDDETLLKIKMMEKIQEGIMTQTLRNVSTKEKYHEIETKSSSCNDDDYPHVNIGLIGKRLTCPQCGNNVQHLDYNDEQEEDNGIVHPENEIFNCLECGNEFTIIENTTSNMSRKNSDLEKNDEN